MGRQQAVEKWWLYSAAVAVLVGVGTALLFLLPVGWPSASILAFLLTLLWFLNRNPRFWYRRIAAGLISILVSVPILQSISFEFISKELVVNFATGAGVAFYAVVGTIVAVLLFLDFQTTKHDVHDVVQRLKEVPATELQNQSDLIEKVTKNRRDKLVLQLFQSESKFFSADTESLGSNEKRDVIFRQLALQERKALLNYRLQMVGLVLLGLWLIGVSATFSMRFIPHSAHSQVFDGTEEEKAELEETLDQLLKENSHLIESEKE